MHLAALDGGGHTEGVADRFAERLGAIDDEQPGQRWIEPLAEEIVEQGLDDDRVLRRPLDHGQDMLVAGMRRIRAGQVDADAGKTSGTGRRFPVPRGA